MVRTHMPFASVLFFLKHENVERIWYNSNQQQHRTATEIVNNNTQQHWDRDKKNGLNGLTKTDVAVD